MHRHRFYGLLLRPSLSSGVLCGLLTIAVVAATNWSSVLHNVFLYDYFFGPEGLVTALEMSSGGAAALREAFTEPSISRNLLIIVATLLILAGLYTIMRVVMKLLGGISMTIREMRAVDSPQKTAVEHDLEKRIGIRLLVLIVWTLYVFVWIKVVLPFGILASEVGLERNRDILESVGYVLFAGAILFLSLHLHIILARLFLLRPRVFGGEDAILGE